MGTLAPAGPRLEPPRPLSLRIGFLVLWFVDMITAGLFFFLPHGTELNPVTVYLYSAFGLPGIVLAAASYAAIVVLVGHVLSEPADQYFLAIVVAGYALLVTNNTILLASGVAPVQRLLEAVVLVLSFAGGAGLPV